MPQTFYKVFRKGTFGQSMLQLVPTTEADNIYNILGVHEKAEALVHLHNYYPQGLSYHGRQYLLDRYHRVQDGYGNDYTIHVPVMELAFELMRLSQFPEKPSRFTSFFGCETVEDAITFRGKYGDGQGEIWVVACEEYFRADMNYLYLGAGIPSTFVYTERYWRGEASTTPFWEILMQGPVAILEKVG
jgi:hypothetical protein